MLLGFGRSVSVLQGFGVSSSGAPGPSDLCGRLQNLRSWSAHFFHDRGCGPTPTTPRTKRPETLDLAGVALFNPIP